jgi:Transcription termination factor nusG
MNKDEKNSNAWYALRTRPRYELIARRALRSLGLNAISPAITKTRLYRGISANVVVPIFQEWVFLFGTSIDVVRSQQSGHILQVVNIRDQAQFSSRLGLLQAALSISSLPTQFSPTVSDGSSSMTRETIEPHAMYLNDLLALRPSA